MRVIDTETTSLEGNVLEIACVDIVDGVICNPMSDFLKPTEAISFEAMDIHHIIEDMVTDAPLISEVIGRYLGADAYVAHNAKFNKSQLPQIEVPWICTLKLARIQYPKFASHGNQYMRYRLDLKPDFIAPQMGHANAEMVCKVYGKWMSDNNQEQIAILNQKLSDFAPPMPKAHGSF